MGSAMAEPYYVRITRSAGLLWLRIRSWHTNRDSAGIRLNIYCQCFHFVELHMAVYWFLELWRDVRGEIRVEIFKSCCIRAVEQQWL